MNLTALSNYIVPELRGYSEHANPQICSSCGEVIGACTIPKSRTTRPPTLTPGFILSPGLGGSVAQVWVSVLLTATLTGCAARARPQSFLPSVNIPLECAISIRLVNCDLSANPLRCRITDITYRKGCEQVMAVK